MTYKRQRRAQGLQIRDFGDGGEQRIKEKLSSDLRGLQTQADALNEQNVRSYQNYKENYAKEQRNREENQEWSNEIFRHQQDALERRKVSEVNYHKQKEKQYRQVQQDWEYLSPILAKNAANVAEAAHGAWNRIQTKKSYKETKLLHDVITNDPDFVSSRSEFEKEFEKLGYAFNESELKKFYDLVSKGDTIGAMKSLNRDAARGKNKIEGIAKFANEIAPIMLSKFQAQIDKEHGHEPLHVRTRLLNDTLDEWKDKLGIADAETPGVKQLDVRLQKLQVLETEQQSKYEYKRNRETLVTEKFKWIQGQSLSTLIDTPETKDRIERLKAVFKSPEEVGGALKSDVEAYKAFAETYAANVNLNEDGALDKFEALARLWLTPKDAGYQAKRPDMFTRYPEVFVNLGELREQQLNTDQAANLVITNAEDDAKLAELPEIITKTIDESENAEQVKQQLTEIAADWGNKKYTKSVGAIQKAIHMVGKYDKEYKDEYLLEKIPALLEAGRYSEAFAIAENIEPKKAEKLLNSISPQYTALRNIDGANDATVTETLETLLKNRLQKDSRDNISNDWDTLKETTVIAKYELFRLYDEELKITKDGEPTVAPALAWKNAWKRLRAGVVDGVSGKNGLEDHVLKLFEVQRSSDSPTKRAIFINQHKRENDKNVYYDASFRNPNDTGPITKDLGEAMREDNVKIFSQNTIEDLRRAVKTNSPMMGAFNADIRKWVRDSGGSFYELVNDQFKEWGITDVTFPPCRRDFILSTEHGDFRPGFETLREYMFTGQNEQDLKTAGLQFQYPRAVGTCSSRVVNTVNPEYQEKYNAYDEDTMKGIAGLESSWVKAGNDNFGDLIKMSGENSFKVPDSLLDVFTNEGPKYGIYFTGEEFYYEDD